MTDHEREFLARQPRLESIADRDMMAKLTARVQELEHENGALQQQGDAMRRQISSLTRSFNDVMDAKDAMTRKWQQQVGYTDAAYEVNAHRMEEIVRLTSDLIAAKDVADSFARRIAAQSELLGKRAEKTEYAPLWILYSNHANVTAWRRVQPVSFRHGVCLPWHPTPTLLMEAVDLEKQQERTFDITRCWAVKRGDWSVPGPGMQPSSPHVANEPESSS